jgi:hypothetical protein
VKWDCNAVGHPAQCRQSIPISAQEIVSWQTPVPAFICGLVGLKATLIKWHNRHGIQKVSQSCYEAK